MHEKGIESTVITEIGFLLVLTVNNLEQFIDMTDSKNEFGEVFTLMELVRKFYKPRQLS
jgi:hypothetical protein